MTPREKECLDAIEALTVDGVSPTYDQIAAHMGLKSKSGVHRMVSSLEAQGHLRRRAHCKRDVQVMIDPALVEIVSLPPAALKALADRVCVALEMQRAGQ